MPQHLVDLPRLQHLHEGQGPARRALHHQPDLRDLRRQPRHLLGLQPEHGLRRPAAAPGRVDHQPGRGRGVHVRPQHLPGEPGRGGLLRADGGRDQPGRAGAGQPHRGAARGRARLPDHRRHHALAEPARGRVLPRGAPGQPVHPGDVLPDGGQARAPVHAVPGRGRHGRDGAAVHRLPDPADALRGLHEAGRADARRPVRLLLRGAARLRGSRPRGGCCSAAGAASRTPSTATSPTGTWRPGDARCSSPRASWWTASCSPRPWSTSTWASGSCSVTRSTRTGRTRRCSSPTTSSATRSTGGTRGTSTPSPSRRSATSTTRTPGRCRRAGSTARTTCRSTPAAARSPGCGRPRWPAWSTAATCRPPGTA